MSSGIFPPETNTTVTIHFNAICARPAKAVGCVCSCRQLGVLSTPGLAAPRVCSVYNADDVSIALRILHHTVVVLTLVADGSLFEARRDRLTDGLTRSIHRPGIIPRRDARRRDLLSEQENLGPQLKSFAETYEMEKL